MSSDADFFNEGGIPVFGGEMSEVGGHRIFQFKKVGVSRVKVQSEADTEYLIVAGGGAGGNIIGNSRTGGGGGGDVLAGTTIVSSGTYPVLVPPASNIGGDGFNASVFSVTALGGGVGGTSSLSGRDGGCGGGGSNVTGSMTGGVGTSGGDGGNGVTDSGGGGGGAGGNGANGSFAVGGAGGVGITSSITGNNVEYGGGGGGAGESGGVATGGGGAGAITLAFGGDGLANRGGGGGGSRQLSSSPGGSLGGSGIVIIRHWKDTSVTPLLLDLYPGAAAAYSLRKLRTAYTGACIRVRRTSDSAEQDIGFTSGGELDESALTTFCGADDGLVTTWYDQSGSDFDVTQDTAGDQPQIVSTGSLIARNGKASIEFSRSTGVALRNTILNYAQPNTYSIVSEKKASGGARSLVDGVSSRNLFASSNLDLQIFAGYALASGSVLTEELSVFYAIFDGVSSFGAINGTTQVSGDAGDDALTGLTIGNDNNGGNVWDGYISEVVLWSTNQAVNQSAIEANQAAAHGITL